MEGRFDEDQFTRLLEALNRSQSHRTDVLYHRIVLAVLGTMFAVMTSIGGFTASRLTTQLDDVTKGVDHLSESVASQSEIGHNNEKRLDRIERLLDDRK